MGSKSWKESLLTSIMRKDAGVSAEKITVYPSAGLALAYSVPMAPEAPGRFKMTTGTPRYFSKRGVNTLAATSVTPPAPHGTTRVTPFSG